MYVIKMNRMAVLGGMSIFTYDVLLICLFSPLFRIFFLVDSMNVYKRTFANNFNAIPIPMRMAVWLANRGNFLIGFPVAEGKKNFSVSTNCVWSQGFHVHDWIIS